MILRRMLSLFSLPSCVAAQLHKVRQLRWWQPEPVVALRKTGRIRNLLGLSDRISTGAQTIVEGELLALPAFGRISIGKHCYIGKGTSIWSAELASISNNFLISYSANIYDNERHLFDPVHR